LTVSETGFMLVSTKEGSMSIREVAARAGVSPATVSRVFTRPDAVAVDTRRRVIAAADELRYAPHPVARSLARGRTGNLGIVVPDIANSFSAAITKAVQQEARRDGYALFVAGSDEVAHDEERWARAMAAQVDGLLLVSPLMSDDTLLELADATAVVLTNRLLDGIPAVLTDATDATGHAVEHLHALGHREMVYLAGPAGYSNAVRLRGFRDACRRLGVAASELGPFNARFSAGVRAADLVLATSATAVVAYNDEVAVGVINRLRDRGLRVPEDRSVVGFDDTPLAEMVAPRLTTVRIAAAAAGAAAVRMLIDVIAGRDDAVRVPLRLPAELVVRASTGPAPAPRDGTGEAGAP
jgi:DNA-binding LacI/PurR family transcriptional regulator